MHCLRLDARRLRQLAYAHEALRVDAQTCAIKLLQARDHSLLVSTCRCDAAIFRRPGEDSNFRPALLLQLELSRHERLRHLIVGDLEAAEKALTDP